MAEIKINFLTCATDSCGLTFPIVASLQERLRGNHQEFFCPFGHSNYYPHKSEKEILQEKLRISDENRAELSRQLLVYKTAEDFKKRKKRKKKK